MARNRQRAKQRQAERRAARLGDSNPGPSPETVADEEALEQADLYTGAPPEDTGRSDTVVEHEPPPPDFDTDDEALEEAVHEYEEAAPERRRRRDRAQGEHHE